MNKTFVTVIAAVAIAATPLFAHHGGPHHERDHYSGGDGEWCLGSRWCLSQPEGHQHTRDCYYRAYNQDALAPRSNAKQKAPKPKKDVSKSSSKDVYKDTVKVTCGTVSSVNKDASTITLKDADGADVLVHISPFTYIEINGNGSKPINANQASSPLSTAAETTQSAQPFVQNTLSDISTGSTAIVRAFNTDTKTVEAKALFVRSAS